jgi:hypothetical protein
MWLLTWVVAMVLTIGVIGGVLGALADRAARPGVTPLGELVAGFFSGRAGRRDGGERVLSHG